ncbi:hypothetical protein BDZ45DRAFT_608575, partial [Acephala macrosclerotiorum]
MFSRDPITRALREQAVRLSHTWNSFRVRIPRSEQEELEGRIPSVEGLIGMVDTVAREWQNKREESKSRKYMKYFTGFCQTLDAHSYMLEVLPSGNQYVSLFTGSLKTIINATSNYEKIARGLGEALSKISVHVVACEKEVRLHQTKAIQEKIALLYAHVFLFLGDTMDWYLKKPRLKLRDAFRENFYEQFEDLIVTIQDHSKDVLREANLSSMAETKQIRKTTEDILKEFRSAQVDGRLSIDEVSREQAEIKHRIEQLRLEMQREGEERRQLQLDGPQWMEAFRNNLSSQIATGIRQELLSVAKRALDDRRLRYTAAQTRQSTGPLEYFESYSNMTVAYDRDSIMLVSNQLFDFFSPSHLQSPYQSPTSSPISLDTTAASRLKDWTTSTAPDSRLISIAGRRPKGLEPPPMSVLASMCVEFAAAANLPVISYFISLPPSGELRESNSREVQALISLTYALIRQLIEQLPTQFSSSFDFSQGRLSILDGTPKTWTEVIELMKDLVQVVPKPLFCILDGFQVLDDWSTEALVEDLVKVLGGEGGNCAEGETLKVLVTTTGRSRALVRLLKTKDLLLAD